MNRPVFSAVALAIAALGGGTPGANLVNAVGVGSMDQVSMASLRWMGLGGTSASVRVCFKNQRRIRKRHRNARSQGRL